MLDILFPLKLYVDFMNRNISENNTIIMPEMINVLIIPEIIDIGPKMDVKKLSIPKYPPYIS